MFKKLVSNFHNHISGNVSFLVAYTSFTYNLY